MLTDVNLKYEPKVFESCESAVAASFKDLEFIRLDKKLFSKSIKDKRTRAIDKETVVIIEKEFNQQLKIKKLNTFKTKPFQKNNSNSNGNINFDSNFFPGISKLIN